MQNFPITIDGFQKLQSEIKKLKTEDRPKIIEAIATARELGDLSENAEYHAAKEQQSFIETKIMDLEDKSSRSEIIDITKLSGNQVKFGATVSLQDLDNDKTVTYIIAGEYEANLQKCIISMLSPIARALISKKEGEIIEIQTPGGEKAYQILSVKFEPFNI